MINNIYIFSSFLLIAVIFFLYLFFYFRSGKNELSNKILLKNLLENLDVEIPEELKTLDNSPTKPHNFL